MGGVPDDPAGARERRREDARAPRAGARLVREVAYRLNQAVAWLSPDPMLLIVGVAVDLAIGDPVYPWHPIRLVGRR